MPSLLSVNVAPVRPLLANGRRVNSAIGKRPVDGAVTVRPLGLEGDEQADLTVHGGLSKAVYAYPSEHYAFWRTVRAQASVSLWNEALPWGFVGENLTLAGLVESDVYIGDVLRFPNCVLAVSEPRFPCFKFNAVMGFGKAAEMMLRSAWCGFYLAVRDGGSVRAGDAFEVLPGPREVGIVELFRARSGGRSG